jgi:hypothetical protein
MSLNLNDSHEVTVTVDGTCCPFSDDAKGSAVEYEGLLWRRVPKAWSRASAAAQDSSAIGDRIIPANELSVARLVEEENSVHREVEAEIVEAERLQNEKLEREHQAAVASGHRADEDPHVIEEEFLEQERFYYAVPPGTSPERVVLPARGLRSDARMRERPQPTAIPQHVPDEPTEGLDVAMRDPSIAIVHERIYAERLEVLKLKTNAVKALREAAEFDGEELMFAVDGDAHSSDDSDGYNEDFEEEWREETNEIYSACRAVECNVNDEEAFIRLGRLVEGLEDAELTPTEQEMLWNALRWVYRKAEPMHPKHWLTSCSSILRDQGFASRPSVGNWCYLLSRMILVQCFSDRRKEKIVRWRHRAIFLVRKRLSILREFGVMQPSWGQVHVSVGSHEDNARLHMPVPTMTLNDTLDALTAHSQPLRAAAGGAKRLL